MSERLERAAVVAETLSWIGTAYHHQGRIKCLRGADGKIVDAGGVDCAMLLYCVFLNVGLIRPFEIRHYPPDWHLHRSEERYLALVMGQARQVESPEPGDVVLYKYGRAFAHGGIVVDPGWPAIVHALVDARKVILDRGDGGRLAGREHKFFSRW